MGLSIKKFMNNITSPKVLTDRGNFLKRLGLLLKEGYSLKEASQFLIRIESQLPKQWAQVIEERLNAGHPLHQALAHCDFPPTICTQIYLANVYGDYASKIVHCGDSLLARAKKQKKFQQVIHYPMILLLFMGGMILLMRFALLPQIEMLLAGHHHELDLTTRFLIGTIHYSPLWLSAFIGGLIVGWYYHLKKFQKKSVLEKINWYLKIPLIKHYLELYWTSFYYMQWSEMLKSGCSLYEIVKISKSKDSTPMFQELGGLLEMNLRKGWSFADALKHVPFLSREALAVVEHGEKTGKLATEMQIYHLKCDELFERNFEMLLERIQPVVFVVIAVLIIGIYAALMLPTFKMMEVF